MIEDDATCYFRSVNQDIQNTKTSLNSKPGDKIMRPSKESFISKFFRMESSGGITLMLAAALAVVLANTPLYKFYALFLDIPI